MLNEVVLGTIFAKTWKYAYHFLFYLACYRDLASPSKAHWFAKNASDVITFLALALPSSFDGVVVVE